MGIGLEGSVEIPQGLEVTYWGCAKIPQGAAINHPAGEEVTQIRGHAMHCVERMSADSKGMRLENVSRLCARPSSNQCEVR